MESSSANFRIERPFEATPASAVDVSTRASIAALAGTGALVLPHGAKVAILHSNTQGALPIPLNFISPDISQALLVPYSGLINAKITQREHDPRDGSLIFNKLKVEQVTDEEHSKRKQEERQKKRARSREFILSLLWKIRQSFIQDQLTIFSHPLREKKTTKGHSEKPLPRPM